MESGFSSNGKQALADKLAVQIHSAIREHYIRDFGAVSFTIDDLAYIAYFRQTCKRYNIDFASADQDERDFVVCMAEKDFCRNRLDPYRDPYAEMSGWKQWTGPLQRATPSGQNSAKRTQKH